MTESMLPIDVRIAVLESRLLAAREAMELQAREYERRLAELNHAHENQAEQNSHFVSRELWESKADAHQRQDDIRYAEIVAWRREVDRQRWITLGIAAASGGTLGAFLTQFLGK